MSRETIQQQDLPPRARELVDVIGLAATLALIERWGGTRVYIPAKITDGHPLARHLGRRAATALARHMAGESPEIPRAAQAVRAALYRQIYREYTCPAPAQRKTAAQLAREHGCTERWIYEIVSRYREAEEAPPPPQHSLI